jgi:glucose-6-phosphate isomerase
VTVKILVTGEPAWAGRNVIPQLITDRVASRIRATDVTLWGPDSEAEASVRLGWTEAATVSRPLVPEILALRDSLRAAGITHIVLGGMGGSSLAPETITRSAGVELTVLDATDPDQVLAALADRLATTAVVISSKSGGTVETDSQKRVFEFAFEQAGIDPTERIIIVTDPGSPLDLTGREAGYRVFNADPTVGGRYSALTAFGLVPSGLAGADIAQLLAEAEAIAPDLGRDSADNPALILGAAIAGTSPLRDKLAFIADGSRTVGFGDWAEQLISESTGKIGRGILPVVMNVTAPELDLNQAMHLPDVQFVRLVDDAEAYDRARNHDIVMSGPLGAQMMVWEYATVIAGRILGINPFDQPDVEAAKIASRGLLDGQPELAAPDLSQEGIDVRGSKDLLGSATTVKAAINALLSHVGDDGYIAIHAYANRLALPELEGLRDLLATKARRPVTFGWGPRFLHSTGQYHKGGTPTGVFLQITTVSDNDLPIPRRPFTFGQLITAQAAGDAAVLASQDRPVLTLNLTSPRANLPALIAALS